MSNSLYNQLNNRTTNQNPLQMIQQIKQNPQAVLKKRGFEIPDGMNNPNEIIQHLLSSGQINNGRLAQAQQMMNGFR